MVEIKKVTYQELANDSAFDRLVAEFADECRADGLPYPSPDHDSYIEMEKSGALVFLGAYKCGALAGWLGISFSRPPQYESRLFASQMSFFVERAARKYGAGKLLIDAAEEVAKNKGAIAFAATAKANSAFSRVVERWGYVETSRIYIKPL